MLILEIALFLIYTAFLQRDSAYESSQDYYDDYQELGEAKGHMSSELEHQLRSVSSVDELMTIFYPEHWKMLKCQSMKGRPQYRETGFETAMEEPVAFAATFYNPEILKSIDSEWKKTQCMPREVSLDVGKEFGSATNIIFKPSCVSVYRCGGCCNSEGVTCMNTSTSYVSKTLFEISVPISQLPKPITISVANHTSCRCMSKLDVFRQVHSIIRRSISSSQSDCLMPNRTCPKNHIWNSFLCRCVMEYDFSSFLPPKADSDGDTGFYSVCGPNKELDEDTCQCVCFTLRPVVATVHPVEVDQDAAAKVFRLAGRYVVVSPHTGEDRTMTIIDVDCHLATKEPLPDFYVDASTKRKDIV
ncbi:hypothetical protein scyTo_0005614 [Scyliorhinus torazame]|uniref:Vascular endothelial growth factor C n=1 Tax=Scyliorhinus torazame TaxID=75743 RepID=A0A401PAM0_SCYTO|nr:hypothetical protein [Scyliorhinus torazame]